MKFSRFVLVAFIVALGFQANAQRNFTAEADEAFNLKQYSLAIELYQKASDKIKGNKAEKARIVFQTGLCYHQMNDTKRSEVWFKKGVKIKYEDALVYYYYAEALRINGKYDEAIVAYQDYKAKAPSDERASNGIEACTLASSWTTTPTRYQVENMKAFNSKFADFGVCYADRKYKSLIFSSNREESTGTDIDDWTGNPRNDLYMVTVDRKGKWSTPALLGEPINTKYDEGSPVMNSKATTLYYTRCDFEKKKQRFCDIYVASKKGPNWDMPERLALISDSTSPYVFGDPSLSDDELTLYFVSDMPGGQGGKDVWKVTRDKKSKPFGSPINLGPTINTPGDERFPYIHDNGNLFFSSTGHIGMGGLDLFRAEVSPDGTFKTPENLKYPMNSSFDDFGIIFEGNSVEKGYFVSNRTAGRGSDDIYSFVLPPLIFTLKGVVTDDSTKAILKGAVVEMKGSDGSVVYDTTDATGMYLFEKSQVKQKTTYTLLVKSAKYMTCEKSSAQVTTVGKELSEDLKQDLALIPIPKVPIVLPDILYDLARWELKPQYQDSLNGLYKTLKDNDNIVIELSSHTDIRGNDLYNDSLSYNRAKSVVDYLITKGIAADRMVPRGYGEKSPRKLDKDKIVIYDSKPFTFAAGTELTEQYINSLKTKEEQEAAHQLNRRTEFRILREDYVPKDSNKKVEPVKIEIIKSDAGEETEDTTKETPKVEEKKTENKK